MDNQPKPTPTDDTHQSAALRKQALAENARMMGDFLNSLRPSKSA